MEASSLFGGGKAEMDAQGQPEHVDDNNGDMELILSMGAMDIECNFNIQVISAEAIYSMSDPVRREINEGKVFACQFFNGRRRISRLNITDDQKLCLHCLREEAKLKSLGDYPINHSDLMRLVNSSCRLVFLDLAAGGITLGRLYIRLAPECQAAKQFAYLCTGELGPSYTSTTILEVYERGSAKEYVSCGDYEMNDGSKGKALVPGLGEGEEYNRAWVAGTVWGFLLWDQVAAQFCIMTKDNPGHVVCSPSFGMVEEGLEILTEVIRCVDNIRNVYVIDCGIVLPYAWSM